jgi:hypothetical protein
LLGIEFWVSVLQPALCCLIKRLVLGKVCEEMQVMYRDRFCIVDNKRSVCSRLSELHVREMDCVVVCGTVLICISTEMSLLSKEHDTCKCMPRQRSNRQPISTKLHIFILSFQQVEVVVGNVVGSECHTAAMRCPLPTLVTPFCRCAVYLHATRNALL